MTSILIIFAYKFFILTAETILYLFLFLVALNYIFNSVLEFLNTKNWKNNIPENFKIFTQREIFAGERLQD